MINDQEKVEVGIEDNLQEVNEDEVKENDTDEAQKTE